MIDLLPVPRDGFHCPCGAGPVAVDGFALPGMMPLARTHCEACRKRFLFHLHLGFSSSASIGIDEATGDLHNTAGADWYCYEVKQMWDSRHRVSPPVEVRGALDAQGADIVLVNSLDPTYGHNIARMFAVASVRRFYPDSAIVVITSRATAWLVPDYVDQTWVVDAPLRELHLYNDQVDRLAQELLARAARVRYAPIFYGNSVNIEDFTKQPPFSARTLDDTLPARLVLNWREDRCWTHLGRELPPQEAVADQLRTASLLFEALRRRIPDLQVTVTGYGRFGRFADWIEDLRIVERTDEAEQTWVRRYARAHVTMGIHGSNMHLPSAHAAGSIEIIPSSLWYTAQDTWEWVNRHTAHSALQRYLKLPHSTSLSDIASIVFSHLRRMQAGAAFHLLNATNDVRERERLMVHVFPALQGGGTITVIDQDGRPL